MRQASHGRAPRPRFLHAQAPAWVLVETAAQAAFALVSLLVISRAIGPEQAGIGAEALAVFLLLDLVGTMLLSDTVIQHRGLTPRHAGSAATVSVAAGCAAAACQAALAPVIAAVTGQPTILPMLLALAPLLPLSAYSAVAAAVVLRQRRNRLLALRVLACQPAGLAAGLAVAWAGGGAWAAASFQAGCTLGVFVLLIVAGRTGLRPGCDPRALAELWPVAGPQFLAELMRSGRYRVFVTLLGATSAPAVVALCNVAFRLCDQALAVVTGSSMRLTLPRLARIDGTAARADAYGELAQFQALLGWPVAAGIALIAPEIFLVLLGPAWQPAAGAARFAALTALIGLSFGDAGSLWVAIGKTRMNFLASLAGLILPVLAILVVRPRDPKAAAICWGAASLLPALAMAGVVLRELGRSPLWLARRLTPAMISLAAMVAAVLALTPVLPEPVLPRVIAEIAVGAGVYLMVAWLTLGRRLPAALRFDPDATELALALVEPSPP